VEEEEAAMVQSKILPGKAMSAKKFKMSAGSEGGDRVQGGFCCLKKRASFRIFNVRDYTGESKRDGGSRKEPTTDRDVTSVRPSKEISSR